MNNKYKIINILICLLIIMICILTACIIIIKNVPSQVCKQCGEISYSDSVAKQLEKLVNSVRNVITEITIINYTEMVA